MFARKCGGVGVKPPIIVGQTSGYDTGTTITSPTVPSGNNGDLLLLFLGIDGGPTVSVTGWTEQVAPFGTNAKQAVFKRTATGSDSITIVLSASEHLTWVCVRIRASYSLSVSQTTLKLDYYSDYFYTPSHSLPNSSPVLWIQAVTDNGANRPTLLDPAPWETIFLYADGASTSKGAVSLATKSSINDFSEDPIGWKINVTGRYMWGLIMAVYPS